MTSIQMRVRSVLAAPRGQRFSRVPAPDPFPPRKPRGRHRAQRWWRSDWAASTLTFGMALAVGLVVSHVTALLM